ncbi:MAG TPA: NADPH-dependent FMN reductase [Chryseolinea sp.]|nr:NADPH-dependent FMN reductase [Chryseolinea sp.]
METRKKIFAISGSTRHGSSNEQILRTLSAQYSDQLDFHIFNALSLLPHFNPDLDKDPVPTPVLEFRELVNNADGVIICTPEYIFALPGALKNAIEWTVSTTVLLDKPLAFIVASGLGEKTFESLTVIMQTVGAIIGPNSRLLIQGARAKLRPDGSFNDEGIQRSVDQLMKSFMGTMAVKSVSNT